MHLSVKLIDSVEIRPRQYRNYSRLKNERRLSRTTSATQAMEVLGPSTMFKSGRVWSFVHLAADYQLLMSPAFIDNRDLVSAFLEPTPLQTERLNSVLNIKGHLQRCWIRDQPTRIVLMIRFIRKLLAAHNCVRIRRANEDSSQYP